MPLVAIEHVNIMHVREIVAVLTNAGLHPWFDDNPRLIEVNRDLSTTPVYVPEEEAEQARRILANWHASADDRVRAITRGWWRELMPALGLTLAIGGVTWILTRSLAESVVAAIVGFFVVLQVWGAYLRRRSAGKD